jgi:hypothetical protein
MFSRTPVLGPSESTQPQAAARATVEFDAVA